jgi:hypothetical protein
MCPSTIKHPRVQFVGCNWGVHWSSFYPNDSFISSGFDGDFILSLNFLSEVEGSKGSACEF